MQDRIAYQGITFDDVLLEPGYSDVVPREVDVRTQLTRKIRLNIPVLSSPMDTVTESELAIALAQEGGLGIIHKNMSIPDQTRKVDKVKRSENGIITDPITLPPTETVRTARRIMEQNKISGVPITINGTLKGILTAATCLPPGQRPAHRRGDDAGNLVTAQENTTLEAAERILMENKVEKLLLVDDNHKLKGLITIKDIDKLAKFPTACKDHRGRLRVGAAVGVFDFERADSLIRAGVTSWWLIRPTVTPATSWRPSPRSSASSTSRSSPATSPPPRAQGAGRCRCRCGEGRDRPWINLYYTCHLRCGRPPDYGDL